MPSLSSSGRSATFTCSQLCRPHSFSSSNLLFSADEPISSVSFSSSAFLLGSSPSSSAPLKRPQFGLQKRPLPTPGQQLPLRAWFEPNHDHPQQLLQQQQQQQNHHFQRDTLFNPRPQLAEPQGRHYHGNGAVYSMRSHHQVSSSSSINNKFASPFFSGSTNDDEDEDFSRLEVLARCHQHHNLHHQVSLSSNPVAREVVISKDGLNPHYSPITPASAGFTPSSSSSATNTFTFPPSEALLASSSPTQSHASPSSERQFLCPPPPPPLRSSTAFEETRKWMPIVKSRLPSPPQTHQFSLTGVLQHNATPEFAHSEDVKAQASSPPVLEVVQQSNSGGGATCGEAYMDSTTSEWSKRSCQQAPFLINDRPILRRHPMTPQPDDVYCLLSQQQQHHQNQLAPRTYSSSYTASMASQPPYSVPILASQSQFFFGDDLDSSVYQRDPLSSSPPPPHPPLLLDDVEFAGFRHQGAEMDNSRPTTPTLPPPPPESASKTMTMTLGSVPARNPATTAAAASTISTATTTVTSIAPQLSPSSVFQPPPMLPSVTKKKPAPIMIPPSIYRSNSSRLRSPRVWTRDPNTRVTVTAGAPSGGSTAAPSYAFEDLPPYTPPPMLCPNRKGSGLFCSVAPPRLSRLSSSASCRWNFSFFLKQPITSSSSSSTTVHNLPPPQHPAPPPPPPRLPSAASLLRLGQTSSPHHHRQLPTAPCGGPKSAPAFVKNLPHNSFFTKASNDDFFGDADDDIGKSKTAFFFGEDMFSEHRIDEQDEGGQEEEEDDSRETSLMATSRSSMFFTDHGSEDIPMPTPDTDEAKAPLFDDIEDDDVVDEEEEEEDMGIPSNSEAHINVGSAFQAAVPDTPEGSPAETVLLHQDTKVYETLVWNPKCIAGEDDDPKTEESLSNLLKLARSPAVLNCGLNMEYAFHLLCKFRGDFEQTLRALCHESLVVFRSVYSETEYWTTEEINLFQDSLLARDKNFFLVAADLRAQGIHKSVKACVEFYYVWRRMNFRTEVKRYRTAGNKRERQQAPRCPQTGDEQTGVYDNDGQYHLEIDSSAVDRTNYNLRKKNTNDMSSGFSPRQDPNSKVQEPVITFAGGCNATSSSEEGGGTGFPCLRCGRCFDKIKSRNAHMKSHAAAAASIAFTSA